MCTADMALSNFSVSYRCVLNQAFSLYYLYPCIHAYAFSSYKHAQMLIEV